MSPGQLLDNRGSGNAGNGPDLPVYRGELVDEHVARRRILALHRRTHELTTPRQHGDRGDVHKHVRYILVLIVDEVCGMKD